MTPQSSAGNGRILMVDGKWLVPKKKRPKLAQPPKEWTPEQRKVDSNINSLQGLWK